MGQPIGMLYKSTGSSTDEWQIFWYEKNLQGDVVAVYDNNGVKHVSYTYDAWGNTTETRHVNYTAASYNPFRYRGYYYDRDVGLYCLGTRWYSTQFRRFLSPDKYVSTGTGFVGFNMYAYCNNNPVMYVDPSGQMPEWLKTLIDISCYVVSAAAGVFVGITVSSGTSPLLGVPAGIATFGAINNLTNIIYYNYISDGESSLTPSSYNDRYINRWDRLDYTKQQTQQKYYNYTAWRYYSEYNLHMYAWYIFGWAFEKDLGFVSEIASMAHAASVDPAQSDPRPFVNFFTVVIGILGA